MNLNLVQFSGLEEISALSHELGDEAVIVARDFSEAELREFSQRARKAKPKIFSCKVIACKDNNEFQKFRRLADFIAVRGGSPEMNAWAAAQKADLLLQPFGSAKPEFDLATANVLRDNNVYTAFLFSDFLAARGFERAQLIKNAISVLGVLSKAGAPLLFFSGARSREEMRAAKDLSSFGVFLGLKKHEALAAVRVSTERFAGRSK